jgi:hypothetical protein
MSAWPSAKARRVFTSLKRIGWRLMPAPGSHTTTGIEMRMSWRMGSFSRILLTATAVL